MAIKNKSLSTENIAPPKWLSLIGRNHYRGLVKQLTEMNLYNPLEKGLVEMLAKLYADSRDASLSGKEQRESIKLYSQLIKCVGIRGFAKDSEDPDAESDLEEYLRS